MDTLGNLFDQEEAAMLAKAKAEMAAEAHRYNTDPEYRAKVDAEREAKLALLSDVVEEEEEEDDDEGEEE